MGDYNYGVMGNQEIVITDIALLRLAADGDEGAFCELYNRHSASILNYLMHMLNETAAAEDILQEVFIAAWKGARRFKGEAQVKTWLYRIAHNLVVSWWRKRRKTQQYIDDQISWAQPGPEHVIQDGWSNESILSELNRLSPAHRAVIELTFYHGLSYQEIARVLGCPVGTVKSRMSYARQYLSNALQETRRDYRLQGSEA